MNEIKIEKGIQIPSHGNTLYPFSEMQVGDSFACKKANVRSIASLQAKKLGMKFTVRKQPEGYRVWRIA